MQYLGNRERQRDHNPLSVSLKDPSEEFEKWGFTLETVKCFQFTLRLINLNTQPSPVILDPTRLRKTQAGKSHGYRDVIVFEKLSF